MIPRGMLDIDWFTLFDAAARSGLSSVDLGDTSRRIEQLWDTERPIVVCRSVRSGLDMVLSCCHWPSGSEVLMSAVTIPDMPRIVREHGYVPVPVDVDPRSLAPDLGQLQARITSQTRAILVAHLFGSRLDLSEIARVAQRQGIVLWEDVAQGFAADGFPGDAAADISFFSFGTIKAQTALGGALVRFRDRDLAARCRSLHAQWPVQSTTAFRKKIILALVIRSLTTHPIFTVIAGAVSCVGVDFDERLSQSVRGFDPRVFLQQLRTQPCPALVELLRRRLQQKQFSWLVRKTALAEQYCRLLPSHVLIGAAAKFPTRWVLLILSRDPQKLRATLMARGFDATVRGSQIRAIAASVTHPEWGAPVAAKWVSQLLFLPLHPSLRTAHIESIGSIVTRLEGEGEL